jgi:hypothetical protein
MERALGSWPGMLFGNRWINIVCGLMIGLCLQGQALAQEDWRSSRSKTMLVFQGSGTAPIAEFQIPLNKPISDQETTTLTAADLGPITLRNAGGQTFDISRYRWKLDSASRLYLGQSGYKSLIAVYQYGDTSQYSLRLNCRTRKEVVNCAMDGNGPLFDDEAVAKGSFNIGSGSLVAQVPNDRPGTLPPSPSTPSTGVTTRLPRVNGINLQDVQIIPAEKQADPELERAILTNYFSGAGGETRYFYNRIDLNGDNSPETIVYLVGRTACEAGGCTTLIFQSDRGSQYRLVSQMNQINQPIIVSDNRSNRWKDLVTYVASGGTQSGYRLLRYDGRSYPSTPSTQPGLANPTSVRGIAVIGDRIQPDTSAPVLGQGSSRGNPPSNGPNNGNYPPPPPANDEQPIASGGQSSAYRRGYELGQLDAKQSVLRNATRHRTEYDPASEGEFRRGYDNGYSNYASSNLGTSSGDTTTSSTGTGGSWNNGSGNRNGDRQEDWGNPGNPGSSRDDDNTDDTANDPGDRPVQGNGDQYQGQGTLVVSPTSNQGQPERYVLNRIQIESGSRARLLLYTSNQSETIELLGQLESKFNEKSMILSSVDGAPARGTVLIGSNGSLRTTNPIVVDSEDSEISVDFRPN